MSPDADNLLTTVTRFTERTPFGTFKPGQAQS
ncbi:MAG: hypothetical protein RL030_593 [Pseudomonadota bacterium]